MLVLGTGAFSTNTGGLVNGDSVTAVTLTSAGAAATALVQAGGYPIVASAANGTGLGNYDIHYVDGTLTVNKRDLTVTADNRSKTYGNELVLGTGAFSTNTGGLVNGDSVTAVTLTSAGAAATALVQAGGYPIVASAANGTGLGNYDIHYVDGTLTVNKRDLTVTADNRSKTYGNELVLGTGAFSTNTGGLVNGDSVTAVTLTSAGAAATALVQAGGYPIVASAANGTGLGNYDIHYVDGTLTVNKRDLTVTADNRSKTYGNELVLGTGAFSTNTGGLVNGDSVTAVTLTSAGAAATALVQAGGYPIVASAANGTGLGNYDIHYVDGTLTVNKRDLTVTADNRSKTYGNELVLGTGAFSTNTGGLVNGDSVTAVTLTSAGAAATALVQAGGYPIVASAANGTGLGNYDIHYVDGTLTVNKRDLTVTADNRSKTYGNELVLGTGAFSTNTGGLVNGDSVTAVTLTSAGRQRPRSCRPVATRSWPLPRMGPGWATTTSTTSTAP